MPSYALQNDKSHNKADYKEDTRIDDYVQEVAIIFWLVAVGGTIVRGAHAE
jgi:hypothetical protein